MEIILSILQILGIVLLVIIGLILLILIIVLFVPIRYQIFGQMHTKTHLEGKVFWLLHLLRAKASYEDELLYVEIGILWKRISFTKEFGTSLNDVQETVPQEEAEYSKEKVIFNEDTTNTDSKEQSEENSGTDDPEINNKTQTDSNKFHIFINWINKIKEKIVFIKEKSVQIKKLLQDDKNKQAFRHIKEEFIYLIKILLPRKSRLSGIFSTGSPDTTGQIYGVICCFPIIYQDDWNLTPDFESEKAYFDGEFQGKGRIYIFRLVGILIRIIFDKNCRRLYYFINRLGGQNNGRRK